jgi:hypothetical protein
MMKIKTATILLVFGIALFLSGCGGGDKPEETAKPAEAKTEESKGVEVAKDILRVFDEAVKEVVELVKDKPAVEEVKPELDALFSNYGEKMRELNLKYLALRDEDIRLFGDANTYMGENRGKHVFEQNKALDITYHHYGYTLKDEEFVDYLKDGLFNLLETAVKR